MNNFPTHPSPSNNRMPIQTIGIHNFTIFDTSQQQGLWRLHFIWGKKDFRLFLQPLESVRQSHKLALLKNADGQIFKATRLQYLHIFQWYNYDGVSVHNLALEETRWRLDHLKLYVEIPKDFLDMAVELVCREFHLRRVSMETESSY